MQNAWLQSLKWATTYITQQMRLHSMCIMQTVWWAQYETLEAPCTCQGERMLEHVQMMRTSK